MQIIQLSLPTRDFYNPATGELIADTIEGLNSTAKSLKGVWNHEVIDSPDLFDEELAEAWNNQYDAFLATEEDSPDGGYVYTDYEKMLEKFLTEYEHEDWATFKIKTTVFGCGPSGDINWYVLET